MGPRGTPAHVTMVWVLIMAGMAAYGVLTQRWAGAASVAGLALIGYLWARWLRTHPD